MTALKTSDLILNNDGSVFHLHLKPGQIASDIILVGDPDRVSLISSRFSDIELKVSSREFVSHTGTYKGKRISVISTGIGTDNIDIVVNELDALFNIDLEKKIIKEQKQRLRMIRIGTSGALQENINVGSFLLSTMAIGFDSLLNFYSGSSDITRNDFSRALTERLPWDPSLGSPYVVEASEELNSMLEAREVMQGVTISAPGFYGPQGRILRLRPKLEKLNEAVREFSFQGHRITNFEMESSAIFGLGKMLGHEASTICAIIANRVTQEYLSDYKPVIEKLISFVLNRIAKQK